jgi:hypothetical protein
MSALLRIIVVVLVFAAFALGIVVAFSVRTSPPRKLLLPPAPPPPPARAPAAAPPASAPPTTYAAQLAAAARAAARQLPAPDPGGVSGSGPIRDYFADASVLGREAQLDDGTAQRVLADHAPYVAQLCAVDPTLPSDVQWRRGSSIRDAFEEGLTAYLTQDQLARVIWLMDQKNRTMRVRPGDPAADPAAPRSAAPVPSPAPSPGKVP